ncbi:MAG: hypothetical protein ABT01_00365 [Clostridium sp. SCN 57-10]|nr:MAG: hypothetical protein ABT01_00365 [Clostridium sp. SCN 57-10]
MSKTQILYKDVAPGADADAAFAASGAAGFSDLAALPFGLTDSKPIITLEPDNWLLDGTRVLREHQPVAFWSSAISGANGTFASDPSITVTFSEQFSSVGISLAFDTATGDYCDLVNMKWYQQSTLKAEQDFSPDGVRYFCNRAVTAYDKLVITLKRTAKPYRHAKLEKILFGIYRYFGMTELRRASIVNQMDLLALELPVSTARWTVDSREDIDFMFQLKQPVEVQNDSGLIGVYYIGKHARHAKSVYDVSCYDAFGVLAESKIAGGVYRDKSAAVLLQEIVGSDFSLVFEVADTNLSGAILPCTRREAMHQVLFAWGVCASTDGCEGIRIFALPTQETAVHENRAFPGASAEVSAVVTKVSVTSHSYTQDSSGGVTIGGVKYKDTTAIHTVTNPNATATDKENAVAVTGATLISPTIGQAAAQRVYDYYARRSTNRARVVWQGERLGDRLGLPNTWEGGSVGNLTKMEITLSNTVLAAVETR